MSQLRLDGTEVPEVHRLSVLAPNLSGAQRDALRYLATHGEISSVEAGVMSHRHRDRDFDRHVAMWVSAYRGKGCCRHASSDGNEMMKRLMARGLVRRDPTQRGRWIPAQEG